MNHYQKVKSKPLIQIKNLNVKFDKLNVIQDASIDFLRQDQVALVGANGAGKTTLLRVILGLIKPESGVVQTQPRLSIGYLPQVLTLGDKLFPMTVKEVVRQGLIAKKKFPRWTNLHDEQTLDSCLKQFLIDELSNQAFGLLSLGQKQLVLFARMMVQEPDIVFLDEPTSSLDVSRKNSIYDILDNLKKKQVPYVIITHDLPSFSSHILRVIYLEHKVLFDGSYDAFCENETFSPFIHTHAHGDHHDH
ncbi:MAG: metal ABC transporter ATP-binding protein [Firmicutes bacterium]|nr:metal ABC transporter ATP-binding protein [Bacillota bacterium]